MRTLRELAGWAVLPALWIIPVAAPSALAFWVEEDASVLWPAAALLSILAWPGLAHIGRRWRAPCPEEVAEADGRRPVLVVHRSADDTLPWYRRLFVFQRGMWRARADAAWRQALERGVCTLGPVVPFARPPLPPRHGPAAMLRPDPNWGPALERRLKRARLAVVVLDATSRCRDDIRQAFEVLGPRRTMLLMPARPGRSLMEVWPALQEEVPGLPNFDSHLLAVRFRPDGAPLTLLESGTARTRRKRLASSALMLFTSELGPTPKMPFWVPVACGLPVVAGLLSTVAVPMMLRFEGLRLNGEHTTLMGLLVVALGISLAVMGRRQFRLVPANETPFVVTASLPWLLTATVPWLQGNWALSVYSLDRWLTEIARGAAYSAPLLLATSLMLSASALSRRSPNRNLAYLVFGGVALVPFATLVAVLSDAGAYVFGLTQFLVAGAVSASVAVVAASGDGPRPHSPVPIGAATSAALGIGAWASVATCLAWGGIVEPSQHTLRFSVLASSLVTFGQSWVWFLLVIPILVVVVASLFRGRGTRHAVANVWTLAPMIVVLGLVSTAQAGARTAFSRAYVSAGGLMLARALPNSADAVNLPPIASGRHSNQPLDVVVTIRGRYVGGQRVDARAPLDGHLHGAGVVRIAADHSVSARALTDLVQSLQAAGRRVELADLRGWGIPVRADSMRTDGRGPVQHGVVVGPGDERTIVGTDGMNLETTDYELNRMMVSSLRGSRTLFISSRGAHAGELVEVLSDAHRLGHTDLRLGAAPW